MSYAEKKFTKKGTSCSYAVSKYKSGCLVLFFYYRSNLFLSQSLEVLAFPSVVHFLLLKIAFCLLGFQSIDLTACCLKMDPYKRNICSSVDLCTSWLQKHSRRI